MRYLIIALLLVGCGPGPKSARGDDKPKETYTQTLTRVDRSLESVNETLGNNTAELEAVKEELRAVKSSVDSLQKLLTVDSELSVPVPPVRVDAPPVEAAEQRITFNGKPIDLSEWMRRSVTTVEIVGDVDKHLKDHGLDGDFSNLSRADKIRLHSVAHSTGQPLKSAAPRKVVVHAAVVMPANNGNCPNGNCARPMYGYQTRSRLFGRWR